MTTKFTIPPLIQSAEKRLRMAKEQAYKKWDAEQHDKPWPRPPDVYLEIGRREAVVAAARDSALAMLDAVIAALREPDDQLVGALTPKADRLQPILRALADELERRKP